MTTTVRPLAEVNQEAIQLLYRELGAVDAVRFLRQYTTGFGNYTVEREQLFGDLALDDIVSMIREDRKQAEPK